MDAVIQIKLKKAGFEVITAVDGEEGVKTCLAEKPDVVIIDWMMPKMDGPTATAKIKARMPSCPNRDHAHCQRHGERRHPGPERGRDDYVVKPFAPRELIARVNVALVKAGKQPMMGS